MAKLKLVTTPGKHDILMTREFNAPRELVFRALTDPTLLVKWWGPQGMTTTIDTMDVRKGGLWRYIQRDADGNEYAFYGVYHEITPPERMVYTFEWEGMPGHVLLETVSLTEHDGKTILTDSLIFQSVEDRDGMVISGMEEGAAQGWDRLEALLPDIKP